MSIDPITLSQIADDLKFVSEQTVLAELCQLVASSNGSVKLLSAFCTQDVFRLVSRLIPSSAEKLILARFRVVDVLCGACDIAVLKDAWAQGFRVCINPAYHGKIYAGDSKALIGSSNLTSSGLGYKVSANVEQNCLVPLDKTLTERIDELIASSIPVDEVLLIKMEKRLAELTRETFIEPINDNLGWSIPELDRKLEDDKIRALVSSTSLTISDCFWTRPQNDKTHPKALLAHDLQLLGCPEGFELESQKDYLAFAIERSRLINWIKTILKTQNRTDKDGVQFGMVRRRLKETLDPYGNLDHDDLTDLVKNLYGWLAFVHESSELSVEVIQPNHSEVIRYKASSSLGHQPR